MSATRYRFFPSEPGTPAHRRAMWLLLAAVLVLPVAPALVGVLARLAAGLSGCDPAAAGCAGEGLALKAALAVQWNVVGFLAPLGLVLLLLLAAYAIHNALDRPVPRVVVFACVAAVMALAPVALPATLVFATAYEGCDVNAGGVGDCVAYGVSMGEAFHAAAVMHWFLFALVPTALLGVLGYAATVFVSALANRGRRAQP